MFISFFLLLIFMNSLPSVIHSSDRHLMEFELSMYILNIEYKKRDSKQNLFILNHSPPLCLLVIFNKIINQIKNKKNVKF